MVTLTKALDLHSPKTETPAELARQAVAKYRAQCNEGVYQDLLGIITEESAKGAVELSLYHYDDTNSPHTERIKPMDCYINGQAEVRINIASLVDTETLVKRLESDGFTVKTMGSANFGTVIDTISWE